MNGLFDMDISEMTALMKELGEAPYRAGQVFSKLQMGYSIDEMSELPKALREKLKSLPLHGVRIERKLISRDGTIKYLFLLDDGNIIESVYMNYKHGGTLCISTQAGCRMGCVFCASTIGGLSRNLTAGEMAAQCAAAERDNAAEPAGGGRAVTNVVMMGCGEPLDNYENAVKFIRLAGDPRGMGISPRNISLSTCALVPQMKKLAEEGLPVTLCISLHAARDEIRKKLMPAASAYSVRDIIDAARLYVSRTGRRVIFEYAPIKGLNDSPEDAKMLASHLKNLQCHVNLIYLNPAREAALEPLEHKDMKRFEAILKAEGVSVTIRRSLGKDIQGACGQLRSSRLE
ncbi:MAG: 23S rRNA (adenine(2503)-C(2))-methyltransferase RlmN [Bacillota bacterium]|nr:23S rRNA (adenine(2503)-C(2))-methyltransferase RlmN [Bacillota bacterium]